MSGYKNSIRSFSAYNFVFVVLLACEDDGTCVTLMARLLKFINRVQYYLLVINELNHDSTCTQATDCYGANFCKEGAYTGSIDKIQNLAVNCILFTTRFLENEAISEELS